MRKTILISLLIVLITLLGIGCNLDADEGLFRQISKSEPVVDVGRITLLDIDGSDIYALTSYRGLQKFDTLTKKWLITSIRPATAENDPNPIAKANYNNTVGKFFFTTTALEGENNNLYSYDPSANPAVEPVSSDFQVLQMDPSVNLMLSKSTGGLKVRTIDTQTDKFTISGYLDFPWMIAQNDAVVLISGRTSADPEEYAHTMFNTTDTPNAITGIDNPIVAFRFDGTNYIFIASDGKVWKGTTPTGLTTSETIAFPVDGITGKPIPTFFADNKLFIQGTSAFYAIHMDGTVDTIEDGFATNLRSTSFKITSFLYDGSDLYGGTAKNGIFKVPDLAEDTVNWL